MSGYVKLFSTIITSSIWLESHAALRVWITMLMLADSRGAVSGSIGGLAHIANVSRDECAAALDLFMAPDPDSRTPDNEGRRIEKIDGGWRVLNAEKYRDMRTETQVAWAEKKKAWREQKEADRRAATTSQDMSETVSDSPGTDETRQISSSSTATASSTARETTAVVTAREAAVGKPDPGAVARLLITRLNQGLRDNLAIGEAYTPVPHGHGKSFTAAEDILAAGVDVQFAADAVYERARTFEPESRSRQIRSVAYCTDAVITAWERETADTEARGTSRPAATDNHTGSHRSRRAVRLSPFEQSLVNSAKAFGEPGT